MTKHVQFIGIRYVALVLSMWVFSCTPAGKQQMEEPDLDYEILERGTGDAIGEGDTIMYHETVRYKSGKELYTTRDLGIPVRMTIGDGTAIQGVDLGVRGMTVGELRRIIIPPALSKREEYPPIIHPDSVLVYDIELLEIKE
jgi:peptidylprolyl isomerase